MNLRLKDMYKHKIYKYILLILLLGNMGCDDEQKSIYETGRKVVSLVQQGENATMDIVVDPAKISSALIQAKIDQISAFGITVQAEVRLELVDEYNKKHGTNYEKINPNSYTFERDEFIFPKYTELSSNIELSFNAMNMAADVFYLLPIQMTEIKGDENASIDYDSDIIYLIVSKLPPPPLIHLENLVLTTERGSDKKNWFAAYATNSEGAHTFSIEEAALQSEFMDFVLIKHGTNLRMHPSIIGWQHGADYHKYMSLYNIGFKKLTHMANMNKLFTPDLFNSVNTSEEMTAKIAELKALDNYAYYTTDRMTSHNLQSQITGDSRVLVLGWGPNIGKNEQFALMYIKDVTAINGGEDYTMKFDIKYVGVDIKTASANTEGQNVVIDNPAYAASNAIKEYKGIELTTEIGIGKKNWFSAYADSEIKTFTQQEARSKSGMMDFVPVLHNTDNVALYSAYIGYQHKGDYEIRIAPYVEGFSKLTYALVGGQGVGTVYATKPEHYDQVTDIASMTKLIESYRAGYEYRVANRMMTDKLQVNSVAVFGWGHKVSLNNQFGMLIVRDIQPTTNGHYKVTLDIKVPESDARTPNNVSSVNKP